MRKKLPKIITITFLSVFIIQMICLMFLLLTPIETQAATFEPQVPIGNMDSSYTISGGDTSLISTYIRAIYVYAIGMVGIVATVVMMFGGVLWIVAGGNASKVSEAKAWITSSLTGLLLALSSYMILYTVNPALVNLEMGKIEGGSVYSGDGCCSKNNTCSNTSSSECDGTFYSGRFCHATSKECIVSDKTEGVDDDYDLDAGNDYTDENETGCCIMSWGEKANIKGEVIRGTESYEPITLDDCNSKMEIKANQELINYLGRSDHRETDPEAKDFIFRGDFQSGVSCPK